MRPRRRIVRRRTTNAATSATRARAATAPITASSTGRQSVGVPGGAGVTRSSSPAATRSDGVGPADAGWSAAASSAWRCCSCGVGSGSYATHPTPATGVSTQAVRSSGDHDDVSSAGGAG